MSAAQPAPSHQPIVPILAGCGTLPSAHVGVLNALEDLALPYEHIVGVSGGAMVAALKACGLSNQELGALFKDMDLRRFYTFSLYQLLFRGGLSSGKELQLWLNQRLGGMRFKDLDLNLHIVAADLVTGKAVIFDREHTPKVNVAAAVRASMGIPLLFAYRRWRDKILVDGSMLPEETLRRDWAGDDTPIYCFRLRAGGRQPTKGEFSGFSLPSYFNLLLRSYLSTLSQEYVADSYWNQTVLIDSGKVPTTKFSLSLAQKMELYDQGYATTMEILPNKLARNAQLPRQPSQALH